MKAFFYLMYLILLAAIIIFSYYYGLSKGEIIKINYEGYGCFGSERSELILYENDGDTLATLKIKGGKTDRQLLNSEQINAVYDFVKKVKDLREDGHCTSTSYYTIYTKERIIKKVDEGCWEEGYSDLKMKLFNKY